MTTLINFPWLMRHAAGLAAGIALIATTTIADAKGSSGNASHSQHSPSARPEKQSNGYKSGHDGKKHKGKSHEGKERDGKDRNATRESKHGCNKRCERDKNTIVITNSAGKVLYGLPKQDRETAQVIPGGILITIGDHSFKVSGTSVTIKNFALSTSVAEKAGLQTIVRNRDGTISDVLKVVQKQPI
jgi:hypothetical protein